MSVVSEQTLGGGRAAVFENTFDCAPVGDRAQRTLTLTMVEGQALLITGPEPGIEASADLCEPREPCVYDVPAGYYAQVLSDHGAGPPEWETEPHVDDACSAEPQSVVCHLTMDVDRALRIVWPHFAPPRQVHTLTARMNGYGGFFSFMTDGEPVSAGCSGDCEWEVDAGTNVAATINAVDVTPEISGPNHSCEIVASSSWACSFPMNGDRTFSAVPR